MDPVSLVGGASLVLGVVLTLLTIREKLWPRGKPHALAAPLADIAAAIRERGDRIAALGEELAAVNRQRAELARPPAEPPA